MFFIQPTADSVEAALQSWHWLPIADKTPFAVTALGDVFFEAHDGIWFLDRIEGALNYAAHDQDDLQHILDAEDGQHHYLWYSLLEAAQHMGMHPSDTQCYDFKLAPILGGSVAVENLQLRPFELVLHVAGQVHEQLKDVPEGTPIGELKVG